MADYSFAEMTRALYDGIWSEFCDWGLELAKVRLADETLPAEVREATWWTLVEALDTYLRLLHPVMPFVTEQLWGALPHRASDPELLIVARWPGVGERDLAAEAQVDALVELVRGLRNARAEARVEASSWLPVGVAVPEALGPAFEALRPAVERLAHARPLERYLTRDALHGAMPQGGLAVIAGEIEAVDRRRGRHRRGGRRRRRSGAAREGARRGGGLPRRCARPARERRLHVEGAAAVVEGARTREAELADQVERLRERLGR